MAKVELKFIPVPIMQVLVVVFFAFVMVHVQLILSPWKCMECGDFRENPGRQCMAASTNIVCWRTRTTRS